MSHMSEVVVLEFCSLCCFSVSKQNNVIRLVVDSTSEEKAGPKSTSNSTVLHSLYIGGKYIKHWV